MKSNRLGLTLIELIVAIGLSSIVLGVGYRMYADVNRMQDVESRRESAMLNVQNAMARIKQDVRAASSISGSKDILTLNGRDGPVRYLSLPRSSGLRRSTKWGHTVSKGVTGEFSVGGRGVGVTLRSKTRVHGRPIGVEISSFISPRN